MEGLTKAGNGAPVGQRSGLGPEGDGGEDIGVAQLVLGDGVKLHALVELVRLAAHHHRQLLRCRLHQPMFL